MVAAYVDSISASGSGTSISVTASGLTCSANDVLILYGFGYTSIGDPSGSDVTWTQVHTNSVTTPFGATGLMRAFWGVAPDAALSNFTMTNGENDQHGYILVSISGADTTTPIDAQATGIGDEGDDHDTVCPSISPTGEDSLLLACASMWCAGTGTDTYINPPSGMTSREIVTSFDDYALATLALVASGATGTKIWDAGETDVKDWIGSSIAVKTAAAGTTTRRYGLPLLGIG